MTRCHTSGKEKAKSNSTKEIKKMKIKIIKENIMKEQKARPAILYCGRCLEFMGQQAYAKLNDIETGKINFFFIRVVKTSQLLKRNE